MSIIKYMTRIAFVMLITLFQPLLAAAPGDSPPPPGVGAEPAIESPPQVEVRCVLVRDRPLLERLQRDRSSQDRRRTCDQSANENRASDPQALVGIGDIDVAISRAGYERIVAYELKYSRALVLYINGVPLPKDAKRLGVENYNDYTLLRYRIDQGEDTQLLWSMLFRERGLLNNDFLRVALGWRESGPGTTLYLSPHPANYQNAATIGITTELRLGFASGAIALLIAGLTWIALKTDALRDASLPDWFVKAKEIRAQVLNPPYGRTSLEVLQDQDANYSDVMKPQYVRVARAALDGTPPPPGREVMVPIGLALDTQIHEPQAASYSLARVQLAMWFAFAIAAGLFLWIVYGQLLRIDGSLVTLLLISTGTTALSTGVDRNAGSRPYASSKGFFLDLVTGFDESQQVHRYQAVVVNLLLLFVGISHVLQQLNYPIFEATWLGLLGVSGAALGLGKQTLEKPLETVPNTKPPVAPATSDGSVG